MLRLLGYKDKSKELALQPHRPEQGLQTTGNSPALTHLRRRRQSVKPTLVDNPFKPDTQLPTPIGQKLHT